MARKKFYVDWSDRPFPVIRPIEVAWNPSEEEAQTFTQCKREIIEMFRRDIEFARGQINYYRKLRVKDVRPAENEEEE